MTDRPARSVVGLAGLDNLSGVLDMAKFRVTDKDGLPVASYDHYSELVTYLNQSYPDWEDSRDAAHDDANFDITDEDGKLVARVMGDVGAVPAVTRTGKPAKKSKGK